MRFIKSRFNFGLMTVIQRFSIRDKYSAMYLKYNIRGGMACFVVEIGSYKSFFV